MIRFASVFQFVVSVTFTAPMSQLAHAFTLFPNNFTQTTADFTQKHCTSEFILIHLAEKNLSLEECFLATCQTKNQ